MWVCVGGLACWLTTHDAPRQRASGTRRACWLTSLALVRTWARATPLSLSPSPRSSSPDERSLSIPINFTLVAEHCNTWRAFWDVQAGQYASTQPHRYDCVNGAMEFWASGSTMAAEAFSAVQ